MELGVKQQISGKQQKRLVEALVEAFPSRDKLAQMLKFQLDKSLEEIYAGASLWDSAFRVVEEALTQGWLGDLIKAGREENSRNATLASCETELSQLIHDSNSYLTPPQSEQTKAWKVPHDSNPYFTGRKELLKKLANNLKSDEVTTQAIHGLGGVGKTQIAYDFLAISPNLPKLNSRPSVV